MNRFLIFMALLGVVFGSRVSAQMIIYPNEHQGPEQQQQDEGECYVWARNQTGFDPVNPPRIEAPAPQQRKRGGIAKGAIVGGAVGEIVNDDAGEGAATGAVLAGARQARQNAQAQQQQQAAVAKSQAEVDQQRSLYNRAFSACMEGRNYTVK